MNLLRSLVLLMLAFIPFQLIAGPPFLTDDPLPVDFRHWEYYLSTQNIFNHTERSATGTFPHVEINYGVVPDVQLHLILPLVYSRMDSKIQAYGYSYTEMGVKYRFVHESKSMPQIGTFPILLVPTINNPQLSSGKVQLYIPVWFQKSWDKLTSYGGGGYWFNPGKGNRNWVFIGWQAQYDITKFLSLGSELFYQTADAPESRSSLGFNIGGFLNFSEKFHFIFSAGHSLTRVNYTIAYAGLYWTI